MYHLTYTTDSLSNFTTKYIMTVYITNSISKKSLNNRYNSISATHISAQHMNVYYGRYCMDEVSYS